MDIEHLEINPKTKTGFRPDLAYLRQRLGDETFRKRMLRQAEIWARLKHQGEGMLSIERHIDIDKLVGCFLKMSLLEGVGRRNCLNVRAVTNRISFPDLPKDLDGLRLLHISDIHIDIDSALLGKIVRAVSSCAYDVAVITGDYRNSTSSDPRNALELTTGLLDSLRQPVYGILGNHDFIEMIEPLERAGLRLLMNETAVVCHQDADLAISGIDDPVYYQTHDLAKAAAGIPAGAFPVLLSHTPDTYAEAERLGYRLQLSGHTHGGQICLPFGIPVVRNLNAPLRMIKGPWQHRRLTGYTSPGTGSCGVPARFFCPPEVTVHILRRGKAQNE